MQNSRTGQGQQGWGRANKAGNKAKETAAPTLDQQTLKELAAKLARLKLVREELTVPESGANVGLRPSIIVQLLGKYNTLLGRHLREICYFHLTPNSQLKCYYRETKKLIAEGFITREWRAERGDNVYSLGHWGRMLEVLNGKRLRGDRRLLWGHDLLTADFMTWVISGARRSGGVAEWRGEYEVNLATDLRPDATGIIRIGGRELRFWLEADTGSEAENVFAEKYGKYHRYCKAHAGAGAGAGSVVLVVTKGRQERLARMIGSVGERQRGLGRSIEWLFTTEELMMQVDSSVGAGPAFERIWYDLRAIARRSVWQL